MATDDERLLIRIEATQRQFERQLRSMNASASRSTRRYERDFKKANQGIIASHRRMGTAFNAIMAGLGVRSVIRYADAWTAAGNKIAAASQISGRQARSLSELNDLADETRAGLTETVDLYSKLLRATANFVTTEEEIARATEITNKAFIAGGAAASERAAGILQLGQALGSSFLQGDELRSIRENAPLLAQAIANEFETTIGGLKALGAEGKLTSERVYRAILNGQADIEAAFASTNATIGDGFTRVKNALTEYIATGDDSIHATEKLVSALNFLAENLDLVAAGAVLLAVRGVTPLAVALAARLAPAAATASLSLQLLTVRGGAALVAVSALKGAMAVLGGPIGIAALAATGLAFSFANSKDAAERLKEATDGLASNFNNVGVISAQLEGDLRSLEQAHKDLAAANVSGSSAAKDAATIEVDAINRRIVANQELRKELLITQQNALNIARSALAASRDQYDADTKRLVYESRLAEERDRIAAGGVRTSENLERAIWNEVYALEQSEAQLNDERDAYRNLLQQQVENGVQLTREQKEWLELSKEMQVAEVSISDAETAMQNLSQVGGQVSNSLAGAGNSIAQLGNQASVATSAIATLVSMIPRLNSAAQQTDKLAKAAEAYESGMRGAANEFERLALAEYYEEAQREINGTAEATRDATSALSSYLDQSHLNGLDARARAIEIETGRFRELEAQIVSTGASEQELADLRAAHTANLSAIDGSFDGAGGGGSSSLDALTSSGNDTIDRLKFEIELIGKTNAEIAGLTYRYEALRTAKEEGLNLDQVMIETGKTLRQTIDDEAAAVANLTLKGEQYREQADFMARSTQSLKDGLIDAMLEGKNFGSVLGDLGKQIAKAALQAALFGQGPLAALFGTSPGKGGGSLLGMLGFAEGGYTGPGGKHEPAGVVHKGEYVFDAAATSRIGIGKLEAIRHNMRGYANGGLVGAPSGFAASGGGSPNINVSAATPSVYVLDPTDARFDELMESSRFERAVLTVQERNRG